MKRAAGSLGAALAIALLSAAAAAQEKPSDPTDIINTLLAGLMGFRESSPAELQEEVAEAGGVPFRADVPLDYMTHEDMVRYVRDMLASEYPPARARADERTLTALDLIPPGTDLRALRGRLLEENIAGFYDERPGRKRLYTVSEDRRLTPTNQLVLAHELRHALQDQYADIHGMLPESVGDFDDRRLAFLGVLEGDATLVMERFLLKRLGAGEAPGPSLQGLTLPPEAVPGAPPVLRDQLVMPYLAGRDFAEAVVRHGGWPAIRAAWSRPPDSTEQILHPDKFLSGEPPRPVVIAYAPLRATLVSEGVLGEMLTRTLLGDADAVTAAAGWGGDLYRVWDVDGRTLLVWRSVWDSAEDAREFREAVRARFRRERTGTAARRGWEVFTGAGWNFALGDQAGVIALVSTDDPALLENALAALGSAAGEGGAQP